MIRLVAIVGPTAAGKSRLAVEIAPRLGAEIVSCDAFAVYRALDVTAAKPDQDERAAVPHHLLDVVEPSELLTAVRYRELARAAIDDIAGRGRRPLLVGGSGLYFRAVVDRLGFAPSDPAARARLIAMDPSEVRARLEREDPASAARIDVRNVRRTIRAVEILELTGRPASELRGEWERRESPYDLRAAGVTWDREELYRRADERLERQLEAGLVDEVRMAMGAGLSMTAAQGVGVKEIVQHLEGHLTLDDALALVRRHTRNLIRRQLSWFRADPRIEWTNVSELGWDVARDEVAARLSSS